MLPQRSLDRGEAPNSNSNCSRLSLEPNPHIKLAELIKQTRTVHYAYSPNYSPFPVENYTTQGTKKN